MQIGQHLSDFFGLERNWSVVVGITRFLAFAYTYHYLNWFSKTKIIRWHEVSGSRMTLLFSIYFACICLYYVDYALGFIAAYFLALIHVFLEFPLNHRSFIGIRDELKRRLA